MDRTRNYDNAELAKFAELATMWWDPNGKLKTLHQVNPIRLGYISTKIDLKNKKVIDVGCGGGILTESMARAGAKVTGIDMSQSVIDVAKAHQLQNIACAEIKYMQVQAETIAKERQGEFDVVTCLEMLEHVPDPQSIVHACGQLLKPGGHCFFSTLNRNPKAYLFAILGAEYALKLLPKNTHDYAKFIRPSELNRWTTNANLTLQELKGISYNPFTQQFKLTNNISINYLFYAIKST